MSNQITGLSFKSSPVEKQQTNATSKTENIDAAIANELIRKSGNATANQEITKKDNDERLAEYVVSVGNVDPKDEKAVVKALNKMKIDFSDADQRFFSEALKEVFGDAFDGNVSMNRMDRSLAFRFKNEDGSQVSYQKNSEGGVTVVSSPAFDPESDEDPPASTYRVYDESNKLIEQGEY